MAVMVAKRQCVNREQELATLRALAGRSGSALALVYGRCCVDKPSNRSRMAGTLDALCTTGSQGSAAASGRTHGTPAHEARRHDGTTVLPLIIIVIVVVIIIIPVTSAAEKLDEDR